MNPKDNRYLFQTDVGRIEMRRRDIHVPAKGQALIRIKRAGICGSDVHYFREGQMGQFLFSPYEPGHEAAGVVVALGEGATKFNIGERVVIEPQVPCGKCDLCRSGYYNLCENIAWLSGGTTPGVFADYVCTDESALFKMPEGMTFQQGAMVEPAAVAVHAIRRAQVAPGEKAIIIGMGPIGLLTLQAFRAAGGCEAICLDVEPARLAMAEKLGATRTINSATDDVDLTGVADVLFETAGAIATTAKAFEMVRIAGRVCQIGWPKGGIVPVNVAKLVQNELRYIGVHKYAGEFPAAIRLISNGSIDVDCLVTHTFPLESAMEAFSLICTHPEKVIKVEFTNDDM